MTSEYSYWEVVVRHKNSNWEKIRMTGDPHDTIQDIVENDLNFDIPADEENWDDDWTWITNEELGEAIIFRPIDIESITVSKIEE